MTKPMPYERREEIRRDDAMFNLRPNPNGIYGHRRELLAEVDRLNDLFEKLTVVVGRLDFDRSESGLPETQEQWIEFVREIDERAQAIIEQNDEARS